jgi:uncharacterized iron-regulated membrane protein
MRRLILNVHLSVALMAGAFLFLLGLTGGIMEFEPELDRLLHSHLSYVRPAGRVLSLSQVGDAVSRQFGGDPIVAYLPSESPDLSSAVILPRGIVCVNQYTGAVLGVRARGRSIFGIARELHIRLASGGLGRIIMRWSGVATLVSLLSGVYLWWPVKRIRIWSGWQRGGFWFNLHNSVGILSCLPLTVLAATGTVIGFEDSVGGLLSRIMRSAEVHPSQSLARRQPAVGRPFISPDQALAIGRAQMPEAIPYRLQMPLYGGAYRVSFDNPRDRVTGRHNLITIDPYSGNVISTIRSSDLSPVERSLATNEAIHTGVALGIPTRIVAWLTSMIVPVQVVSGLLLWLRRKSRVRG